MDNELLQWLRDHEFEISLESIALDGRNYRFNRNGKKNASFWGRQKFVSSSGQSYVIACVYDFKTGESFEFRSNRAYSAQDKRIINESLKEAQRAAEQAKAALQAETSELAANIFAAANVEKHHAYLVNKKIPEFYGARVCKQGVIDANIGRKPSAFGNTDILLIPMRDSNGTLWGLQKINAQGDKYFLAGQKKEGCFHIIPDDDDSVLRSYEPIYVCEGFATGASIYQAIKCPVAIAFDAGNLMSVCQAIRKENPEKPIVICADDDKWTRLIDGTLRNAGRECAEEAAKAVLAKVVYPKFRDEIPLPGTSKKPTDFNDLHAREGLEEVSRQLLEVKPKRHYINCLGYQDGVYFYTSSDNKEITAIKSHTSSELLNVMPLAYWETLYPSARGGVDWVKAADDLMKKCRARGMFSIDHLRGTGVWEDEGRVVVHLGDRLYVDGDEIDIHSIKSRYIYGLSSGCRSVHTQPLHLSECKPMHHLLDLLSFERPEQKYFLAGWLTCARLSGLLKWRPHLWLTAEAGSGKSTVLKDFVYPMLGDHKRAFTGGTTESGMRGKIRSDALPLIYDEFEAESRYSVQRVKGCLEFIRQASSDFGDIVKGTATGSCVQYKARFCAIVGSVNTLLNSQADRTRFTLIELTKRKYTKEQTERFEAALQAFTPDYADRFFARILAMLPVIQENIKRFELAFAQRHSRRLGQQYGPLMAGYAAIISNEVLSHEEIDALVDSIDLNREGAVSENTDQEDCLGHLLQKQITVSVRAGDRQDMTVYQVIHGVIENSLYNDELGRYGLRLMQPYNRSDESWVFISNKNPQLQQLFRDSPWQEGNWGQSLARLPGAKKHYPGKIHGRTTRGVLLPLSSLSE